MADHVIVEREGGGGAGSSAIWAIAFIIIVAMIVGAVYYSGVLNKAPETKKIDVDISVPATR